MTLTAAKPSRRRAQTLAAQTEGGGGASVVMPIEEVVPAHLLDGGEVVHFAIKPSPWFIPLDSARWLAYGGLLIGAANVAYLSDHDWYFYRAAFWVCSIRLAWATLQWVSSQYVLTNRRFMRIRGVFRVELFECPLHMVQSTELTLSPGERLTRVGTIRVETAGPTSSASWRTVARPLEVLEKLRNAINRAQHRGNNG